MAKPNPYQQNIGAAAPNWSPYPAASAGIGSSPTGSISPTVGGMASAYGQGGSVYGSQVPTGPSQLPPSTGGIPGGGAQPVTPSTGKTADQILDELLSGMPQYGGGATDNTDYFAQAQQIYDPQSDYLAGLEAQAKANAEKSGKSLDEMYAELARSIGAQAAGINQNYNTALGNVANIGAQSYGAAQQSFDNTRNGVADTLARLGIQEAAPNTIGQNTEMQQLMLGIINANNMATKNELVSGRQSTLDYNQAQQTGAKLRGGEAREGLAKQLQGFLNELGLKKADLQSQIQQWAMQQKSEADKTAYERYRDSVSDWQWKQEFGASQADRAADNALAAQKAAGGGGGLDPAKLRDMDPIGALGAVAMEAYGGNQQAASNAVKAVTDTAAKWQAYKGGTKPNSLQEFVNEVVRRNEEAAGGAGKLSDLGNLRRLAAQYYERMYGRDE